MTDFNGVFTGLAKIPIQPGFKRELGCEQKHGGVLNFNIDTPDRWEAVRFNRHLRRAHNSRGAFSFITLEMR